MHQNANCELLASLILDSSSLHQAKGQVASTVTAMFEVQPMFRCSPACAPYRALAMTPTLQKAKPPQAATGFRLLLDTKARSGRLATLLSRFDPAALHVATLARDQASQAAQQPHAFPVVSL